MSRWFTTLAVFAVAVGTVSAGVVMLLPSVAPVIGTLGQSDVPAHINHQGVISVNGVRFEGDGKFKFALVRPGDPETVVWTNDGNTPPDAWVELPVTDGVYSVRLGNTSLMNAISRELFSDGDLRLRIWFWDDVHDPAQLEPDQMLSSAPYALTVADDAVTEAKIADGAVTGTKIADGTITDSDIDASAAIGWSKVSKSGAVPGDVGAQPANEHLDDLADGSLSGAKVGSGINAANITTGTLPIARIADGAVTSAKITDGAIVNADVSTSAAIAWSKVSKSGAVPGDVGAAAASHTHSYLPLSGGTLTGTLTTRAVTISNNYVLTVGAENYGGGIEGGEIRLNGASGDGVVYVENYDGDLRFRPAAGNIYCRAINGADSIALHCHTIYGTSKSFSIDHPVKPDMKLVHGCIEGPEYGVYYRGEGQLEHGTATVELPDYFEALTREDGRTIQLTCKNGWSPLYVDGEISDGRFTVRIAPTGAGDNSQQFYWEVKAVRADVEALRVEVEAPAAEDN